MSQSRAASIVAEAAEAADEEPRASMIAAPRFATVGMKSFSIHDWSPTTSAAFRPPTSAWKMSGYWVAEWLPQIVIFLISETEAPVFAASWEIARLWSSRVSAENRSFGMSGALLIAISALVLAGFPVTPIRMSSAATSLSALPWSVKIAPLADSRSPRSIPFVRGRAPTSSARLAPSKTVRASSPISTPARVGNAQSSSSMTTPSSALSAGVISSSLQLHRGVRPEQGAAGDAEEQAVADLAGGAGHGHLDGLGHDGDSLRAGRERADRLRR